MRRPACDDGAVIDPGLPRFALIEQPSPLHRLDRLSDALGGRVDIWIKREDLLPLAFGGNKLRNLEYLVGAAIADGADSLVTAGRRWSNHCRLTAAAGARAGLDVHLVLTGPPVDPPGPNQALDELLGATVHVTATADRTEREALVEQVADDLRTAGRRPYVIGVGGGGAIGAYGQVMAGSEAIAQLASSGIGPTALVVPSATGGTQAGLTVAFADLAAGTDVLGVVVAHPIEDLRPAVEDSRPEARRDGSRRRRLPARSPSTRRSAARATGSRPTPRPKQHGCSPGPRASSSTRSTRPRAWPG